MRTARAGSDTLLSPAGWLAVLVLVTAVVATGCTRPMRSAPIDQTREWPTVLGSPQRSAFAGEAVPDRLEEAWRADVGRGLRHVLLVAGPVVFTSSGNRLVTAISSESGDHYWERRMDGAIEGGMVRHRSGLIIATAESDGEVILLEPVQGRRRWSRRVGAAPMPPLIVGDAVYVGTDAGNVFSIGIEEGNEIWRTRLSGRVAATPVSWDDRLLIPTATDTLYMLGRISGEVWERRELPGRVSAPPALRNDELILPLRTGEVVALALPDLEERWRVQTGDAVLAAPVVAPDGTVYLLNRAASVWRVSHNGQGEELVALGGSARGSLTLAGDRLVVGRLDGTLFVLRPDASTVLRERFEDSIVAPVTVSDGALYVPLLRGRIVKLR